MEMLNEIREKMAELQQQLDQSRAEQQNQAQATQAAQTALAALQAVQGRGPSVRAPLPEPFKGQADDFRYFITAVKAYCELTNVPENKRVDLAASCLGRAPAQVWESNRKRIIKEGILDPKDWNVFTDCMSKTYDSGDRATKARSKLDKLVQGSDSLERYVERFLTLIAEIEADKEVSMSEKIHRFSKGLKPELQRGAIFDSRTSKPFEQIDDLIEFVTRLDAALAGVQEKSTFKGPSLNAVQVDSGPGRTGLPLPQGAPAPYGPPTQAHMPAEPFWTAPGGSPFVAAAVGPQPGYAHQRPVFPRMDGQPPGRRVDRRAYIPMDRQCWLCGRFGCESWRHRGEPVPPPQTHGHNDRGGNGRTFGTSQGYGPNSKSMKKKNNWKGKGKGQRGGRKTRNGRGQGTKNE
jgi:hypothetical protein